MVRTPLPPTSFFVFSAAIPRVPCLLLTPPACRYGLLKAASTCPGFCGDSPSAKSKCVEACKGLAAGALTYDTVCRTCVIQKVGHDDMAGAGTRRFLFFDAG